MRPATEGEVNNVCFDYLSQSPHHVFLAQNGNNKYQLEVEAAASTRLDTSKISNIIRLKTSTWERYDTRTNVRDSVASYTGHATLHVGWHTVPQKNVGVHHRLVQQKHRDQTSHHSTSSPHGCVTIAVLLTIIWLSVSAARQLHCH